jgi:hypothetical protein
MSLKNEIGAVVGWVSGLRSPLVPWATLLAGFIFICTSDDGAHVRFAFLGSGVSAVDSSTVVIIFTDSERSRLFEGRDFRVTPAFQMPHSPTFGASASGPLTVDVRLDRERETLAAGRVTVPLQDGWRYDVSLAVGRESLPRGCPDCSAARAFPLSAGARGTASDSLYVVWSGSPASGLVVR